MYNHIEPTQKTVNKKYFLYQKKFKKPFFVPSETKIYQNSCYQVHFSVFLPDAFQFTG